MIRQKLAYHLLLILLGLFTGEQGTFAQMLYDESYREQAFHMREHVQICTDRNMYAVNERIHFRSFFSNPHESGDVLISKVLYVELVTPAGRAIVRGKFTHGEGGSSGYLSIPDNALTGHYFLRAYTRWMRNFDPCYYSYVLLTIINPESQEVLKAENETSQEKRDMKRGGQRGLICKTNKSVFSEGEKVQLELSCPDSAHSFPGEYCLTVVPAGLVDTMVWLSVSKDPEEEMNFSFKFLPDIRGVSLSGSIVEADNQSPSPATGVHFSLLGRETEYFATVSDDQGRFIVTLPDRTGMQELFVAGDAKDPLKREIRIDQDFSSEPVPYNSTTFSLSPQQRKVASHLVRNMQLSRAFGLLGSNSLQAADRDSIVPFYGLYPLKIQLEEYIELPTMAEVFENLVPQVEVVYRRGIPQFFMDSRNTGIKLLKPLILVDHIPVFDQKAVFDIDPAKIACIEVINEVYLRGELMYGGVIILTSRKGDMASVDLVDGSYFFDYQTFHESESRQMAGPEGPASGWNKRLDQDRIPDTRNVILWSDKLILDPGGKEILNFPAGSHKGEYHILIRGMSVRGEIVYGRSSFNVK